MVNAIHIREWADKVTRLRGVWVVGCEQHLRSKFGEPSSYLARNCATFAASVAPLSKLPNL